MHPPSLLHYRERLGWVFVLFLSVGTVAIPFIHFRLTLGVWFPEVLPQLSADTLYYLKQVREVLDGHPLLGNPFIREYADRMFPGLLLPIWIAALPGLLGIGINAVFLWNAIVWHVVTGTVLFLLFRRLTNRTELSALTAVIGVISLHNFLLRPILQVVYPVLALFLLCLLRVLEQPKRGWNYVPLGIITTITFYLYPHLWMPVFAALGLLFLRLLWQRDGVALRYLLLTGGGIVIACLPEVFIIISLFADPLASMISFRTGLVESHLVLPLTFFNLKYMEVLLVSLLLLRTRRPLTQAEIVLFLFAGGLCMAATSNVLTGKETDFDTHPLWMSFLLNVAAIAVFADAALRYTRGRAIACLLLTAFTFTTVARTVRNAFPYLLHADAAAAQSLQDFTRVFAALDAAGIHESVILAPNALGNVIPLYTDNYLMFSGWAALHVIPDDELLDRFLVQHVDDISAARIRTDVLEYAGFGPDRRTVYLQAAGLHIEPIELLGGEEFVAAALRRHQEIASRYIEYLQRYRTQYAITDALAPDRLRIPASAAVLYRDERFTLYQLFPESMP